MKITNGTKILITGGASGIGKLMGQIVLQKGAELIIWDINQEGIDETLAAFSSYGKVTGYLVDVSVLEQIVSTAELVRQKHGAIDLLINNAGIVVGKYFHQHTIAEITKTMEINANAPMLVALQFLPDMVARKSGHICNIASSAGLISNPKMSVYVASKWAAVGWSDSVRIEMQQLKTNVGITTVTPYYINTGMFDGVRSSLIPILNPEKAAIKIIRGIERNKFFVKMPLIIHFVRLCQGLMPIPVFDFVVGRVLGIYKTMDQFKGRKN
ncbi:MAG: SDR family oxidoreductase [Bacteroidia bacterium]|nr:SDR family oxidoreductase [Bacteroidia bacterium]